MVRITRQKVQQQSRRRGNSNANSLDLALRDIRAKLLEQNKLVLVLLALSTVVLVVVVAVWSASSSWSTTDHLRSSANHPNLHLADKNSEQYNALALDILQTLDCHKLLNKTKNTASQMINEEEEAAAAVQRRRRRLDDFKDPGEGDNNPDPDEEPDKEGQWGDDAVNFQEEEELTPTAKHLFCLAAFASDDRKETAYWKDTIKCDATQAAQQSLLDLWSTARGEMAPELLLQVLDMSFETTQTIAKKSLNLWAPRDDTGLQFMLDHVNDAEKTVDQGGLYGLEQNLGRGKVFVDVGSCLGTTSMAMALLYPGTQIVSVEVAAPNWLLQEVNFRCNAQAFDQMPRIMLTGVGPAHATTTFAKYTWKPDQVTTARAWTKASEIDMSKDVELSVRLRPWHSILAEAELLHNTADKSDYHIDVLNVDCGACEYNLIPSMTDSEFDSITTVMGGVHWGYIPRSKLPSSVRGKETHERLCKHENFARTAKECCEFPSLEVISSFPGHVLVEEDAAAQGGAGSNHAIGKAGTVAAVAGHLCDDYQSTWVHEKHVHEIESDWGWFQITASAQDA